MHIGFIVTKTPAEESFKSFLKILDLYIDHNNVSIFLVGNGVFAAKIGMKHSPMKKLVNKTKVNVSYDDLKARGIDEDMVINEIIVFHKFEDIISSIMENMDQVLSF